MIPHFPHFKKLEENDADEINSLIAPHLPYSDFNFVSLWSWDTSNEREISIHNGNLIVKFTDYQTHEYFLSFLGEEQQSETAINLLTFAQERGLRPQLALVPESSISRMNSPFLIVQEDRDHFDYIYSLQDLSVFDGAHYSSQRQAANRFARRYPEARFERLDVSKPESIVQIGELLMLWKDNKIDQKKEHHIEFEQAAIARLIASRSTQDLLVSGLYENSKLLAFSIEEFVAHSYCVGHFWKADTSYVGIYDYLLREKSRYFLSRGAKYLNYEQDLGLQSLRTAKMALRPHSFLKKYLVSFRTG